MKKKDSSTESSQLTTDEGTYGKDSQMISSEKVSARRFDLLDAEKVAADWEDGPLEVAEAVQGSYEPCRCNNRK